jgi:hypothetical protein
MTQKVLVIFKDDWADEMDIVGFDIISKDEWEYKKLEIEHCPFPQEVGFGTNESNTYESAKEFISNFQTIEISLEQEQTLVKLFRYKQFGTFPYIEGEAPESFYEEHGECPD